MHTLLPNKWMLHSCFKKGEKKERKKKEKKKELERDIACLDSWDKLLVCFTSNTVLLSFSLVIKCIVTYSGTNSLEKQKSKLSYLRNYIN